MVARPGSSPYLSKEALLFLSTSELTDLIDRTIDAQPFLGTLSADPTSRGLFTALGLLGQGVTPATRTLRPMRMSCVPSIPQLRRQSEAIRNPCRGNSC